MRAVRAYRAYQEFEPQKRFPKNILLQTKLTLLKLFSSCFTFSFHFTGAAVLVLVRVSVRDVVRVLVLVRVLDVVRVSVREAEAELHEAACAV